MKHSVDRGVPELLYGYGFQTSYIPLSAFLLLLSACTELPPSQLSSAIANSPSSCYVTITTAQYRQLVASFYPSPGHSYAYSEAKALAGAGCSISSLSKEGRTINRIRYLVTDVGQLSLVLLVENDRVIGYQIQVGGEK